MISDYRATHSWLYRMPAGPKLTSLMVAVTAVLVTTQWKIILVELATTCVLYLLARIPLQALWRYVYGFLPFVVLIIGFHLITSTWERAIVVSGQLLATILLAALITIATKVTDMLELCEKITQPLRHCGVNPARIALVLALTLRCLPLVAVAWREAHDACQARNIPSSLRHRVVPTIVRMLRSAEELGDAIIARNIDPQP